MVLFFVGTVGIIVMSTSSDSTPSNVLSQPVAPQKPHVSQAEPKQPDQPPTIPTKTEDSPITESAHEEVDPVEEETLIPYEIINQEEFQDIKMSYDIRVDLADGRLPTEDELASISRELRSPNHTTTYVVYYLPEMVVDAGGFATGHHKPNLEIRMMPHMIPDAIKKRLEGESKQQAKEEKVEKGFRTWKSANGKFTIEAMLVSSEKGIASLQRKDTGKIVEVPTEKLSEEGQSWIRDFLVQKEDENTKRKKTSNRKRVSAKQPILNPKTCKEGQTGRLPRIKVSSIITMGPDNNAVENSIIGSVDGKNYPIVWIVNSRRHRRAKEGSWFVPGTEVFEVKSVSYITNSGRVVVCHSSKPKPEVSQKPLDPLTGEPISDESFAARNRVHEKYDESQRRKIWREWQKVADRAEKEFGLLGADGISAKEFRRRAEREVEQEERGTKVLLRKWKITYEELAVIGVEAYEKDWWKQP